MADRPIDSRIEQISKAGELGRVGQALSRDEELVQAPRRSPYRCETSAIEFHETVVKWCHDLMGVAAASDRLRHDDRPILSDRLQPSRKNPIFQPLDIDLDEVRLQSAVIEAYQRQSLGRYRELRRIEPQDTE
jgi:hypothetical protein